MNFMSKRAKMRRCGPIREAAASSRRTRGQGRIAALVLGPAGEATTAGADIRLLSARKLVEYIDGGGRMTIRQTLEAAGKDIFLDAATVRGLLPELETEDGMRCKFSGVAALELRVVRADDPDPEGAQLAQLRPVLGVVDVRAREAKLGYEEYRGLRWKGMAPNDHDPDGYFGVFIDFMSMHQPDSGWKEEWKCNTTYSKPEQKASFDRALGNIGLLYGHVGDLVFKLTATPLGRAAIVCMRAVAGRTSRSASATSRRRHELNRHGGVADGRGGAGHQRVRNVAAHNARSRERRQPDARASRRRSSQRRG